MIHVLWLITYTFPSERMILTDTRNDKFNPNPNPKEFFGNTN